MGLPMPELRWTLLIIGLVFLAGLAWWELRRSRARAVIERRHAAGEERGGEHRFFGETGAGAERLPAVEGTWPAGESIRHEPTISLPDVPARDPLLNPPVVEVEDDSLIGLRIDGTREDASEEMLVEEDVEPIVPEPERAPVAERGPAHEHGGAWPRGGAQGEVEPSGDVPVGQPLPLGMSAAAPVDPIVEWPDEAVRRIVALRLVAPGERFSGRAVRQALSAEGFVLGKLSIFHRAGPDGRAIVSAASLTKPGTFDRDSIDMQRYGGLNLFAVLPGPLPSPKAFEELLSSARNLSERLQGALQDDRGAPLTPMRAAMIREALAGEAEASG